MAGGSPPNKPTPARAAVREHGAVPKPRPAWTRLNPRPSLPPFVRSLAEHLMFAGPVLGVLGTLYSYSLTQTASPVFSPATREIIRQVAGWHGRVERVYYITPVQNDLRWGFAGISGIWMVGLIASLVVLGIRRHLRERSR